MGGAQKLEGHQKPLKLKMKSRHWPEISEKGEVLQKEGNRGFMTIMFAIAAVILGGVMTQIDHANMAVLVDSANQTLELERCYPPDRCGHDGWCNVFDRCDPGWAPGARWSKKDMGRTEIGPLFIEEYRGLEGGFICYNEMSEEWMNTAVTEYFGVSSYGIWNRKDNICWASTHAYYYHFLFSRHRPHLMFPRFGLTKRSFEKLVDYLTDTRPFGSEEKRRREREREERKEREANQRWEQERLRRQEKLKKFGLREPPGNGIWEIAEIDCEDPLNKILSRGGSVSFAELVDHGCCEVERVWEWTGHGKVPSDRYRCDYKCELSELKIEYDDWDDCDCCCV